MPMGMLYYSGQERRIDVSCFEVFHIGVGFVVARSVISGNAKALERGTSDKCESCAFFVYIRMGLIRGF
jgi:hypothetical protein